MTNPDVKCGRPVLSDIAMNRAETPDSGNPDRMSVLDKLREISIPLSSLTPGLRLRHEGTDADHVRLLADAAESAELPAILVQRRGSRIIDGMHRVAAAKLRGEWSIRALIVDCTDEEALVLAVRSNTLHGLPLSKADRISSAERILTAHPDWSDRSLAQITALSANAIASIRKAVGGEMQFNGKRLGRDGKRRPVALGEGRRRVAEYLAAHPDASLREVARETDVSLGTAHGVRERLRRGAEGETQPPARPAESSRPATGRVGLAAAAPSGVCQAPGADTTSSGPVRALHSGAGVRAVAPLPWSAISAKMVRDPALRYTDGGRAFLQWMAGHSMQFDEWREFIDAVPQHWLEDVCRIAASMSEEWREFADRLDRKLTAAS
jgi:hypothetical protein